MPLPPTPAASRTVHRTISLGALAVGERGHGALRSAVEQVRPDVRRYVVRASDAERGGASESPYEAPGAGGLVRADGTCIAGLRSAETLDAVSSAITLKSSAGGTGLTRWHAKPA
jgi:hypothetical protein